MECLSHNVAQNPFLAPHFLWLERPDPVADIQTRLSAGPPLFQQPQLRVVTLCY